MSRYAPAFVLVVSGLMCLAAPVRAQELEGTPILMASIDAPIVTADMPPTSALLAEQVSAPAVFAPIYAEPKHPSWFMAFHVLTAGVQAADALSTRSALNTGAFEANPLLAPIAKNSAAFAAAKVGVAAGVIYATGRMARRHPVAAVLTAIAINGTYAMVIAHNYRVMRSLR